MHCGADLAHEVVEHLPVRGGELLVPASAGQDEPPDLLAPVSQLQAQQPRTVSRPLTVLGRGNERPAPADLHRGVRQLQRFRHGVDDRR